MRLVFLLLFTFVSVASYANNEACEAYCDYLCRHYRSDIKPVELRLWKRNTGEFFVYSLSLRIKNIGEQAIGAQNGSRNLSIYVSGLGYKQVRIHGQIGSGQSKWVGLGTVNPRKIKHCSRLKLKIDTNKKFGQWGCAVNTNDTALLKVYEAGKPKLCRLPIKKIKRLLDDY